MIRSLVGLVFGLILGGFVFASVLLVAASLAPQIGFLALALAAIPGLVVGKYAFGQVSPARL